MNERTIDQLLKAASDGTGMSWCDLAYSLADRLDAAEARLEAAEISLATETELNGLARSILCKELEAAETTIKAIGELPRYRVEAVQTWISHICPAFKPTKHGDYVRYDELKKALLENEYEM